LGRQRRAGRRHGKGKRIKGQRRSRMEMSALSEAVRCGKCSEGHNGFKGIDAEAVYDKDSD
jgi:hypothetical protein